LYPSFFVNFCPSLVCHHHIRVVKLKQPQVEGEAQGSEDGIRALLKDLDRGPTHAHVVKLEKQEIDVVEGEEGFEVRH
jgi:hypothetical protein